MKKIMLNLLFIGIILWVPNNITFSQGTSECKFENVEVTIDDMNGYYCDEPFLTCDFENIDLETYDIVWICKSEEVIKEFQVEPPFLHKPDWQSWEDGGDYYFDCDFVAVKTNDPCCRLETEYNVLGNDDHYICEADTSFNDSPVFNPSDVQFSFETFVTSDTEYKVDIKFGPPDEEPPHDFYNNFPNWFFFGYKVWVNGEEHATFQLPEDIEISVGPIQLNDSIEHIIEIGTLCDLDEKIKIDLGVIEPCDLSNVTASSQPCDANEQFMLDIDFEYINASSSFKILGDGINYGVFTYQELNDNGFVSIGPFDGAEDTIYTFEISDIEHTNCSLTLSFEAPDCYLENCGVTGEIEADISAGYSCFDGTAFCDFDYEQGETFDIIWILDHFDVIRYTNRTPPFEYDFESYNTDERHYKLLVSNHNDPCCRFMVDYYAYDDAYENCFGSHSINTSVGGNYSVPHEVEYINDNEFVINITFDFYYASIILYQGYKIFVNDLEYGNYQLPNDHEITIGPFISDGTTYNFGFRTFCDEDKRSFLSIETEEPCAINNIVAEVQECDSNGQFLVDLSFEMTDVLEDEFIVHLNDNSYDTLNYNEILTNGFVTIGPLAGDGETVWEFAVSNPAYPECQNAVEINPITCLTDCHFNNLTASANCEDSMSLTLNFDYFDIQNDSFDVSINSLYFNSFEYDELPLVMTIPGASTEISISETGNPNCILASSINYTPCTGINNINTSNYHFIQTEAYLHLSNLQNIKQVDLFDVSGRKILSQKIETGLAEIEIPISNQPSGMYTLCIYDTKNQLWVRKFVR